MRIFAGSDHAGFTLRTALVAKLQEAGLEVEDLGSPSESSVDYPDYARAVAGRVAADPGARGLLVCGTGIGMCIAANKVPGIRAAVVESVEAARLARAHNDANVLCLGGRFLPAPRAEEILKVFLETPFEGGRHERRVAKIAAIEGEACVRPAAGAEPAAAHLPPGPSREALGPCEGAFAGALSELRAKDAVRRLWARDPTLWSDDPSVAPGLRNRLGWLDAPHAFRARTAELAAFAEGVRRDGFQHVLLLGMGGSSLCAEVLANTLGSAPGFPDLRILDSTSPESVRAAEANGELRRTLVLVSTKSGTTLETMAFYRRFRARMEELKGEEAGSAFVAITDPRSPLERLAIDEGFRRVFLNPEDIGGRFSALSWFGLVPAALLGLDLDRLLARAAGMVERCGAEVPVEDHPAARLASALAGCAREGRDKVTLLLPPTLEALGGWIEQLVAESTGKSGRGLIPVEGEPAGVPEAYGPDRLFVRFHLAGDRSGNPLESLALALESGAHPIVRLQLPTPEDLAAEFFRWEMATALAGVLLCVNPFDEPDVADSKARTKAALERPGPLGTLVAASDGIELHGPAAHPRVPEGPLQGLRSHLTSAREGEAVAFLAFLHRTPRRHAHLSGLRLLVRDRLRRATTLGYGPRYLHSSGQLHKGGPDRAVFVLITAEEEGDVPVPGAPFGFRALRDAQARGDLEALAQRGRRVLAVHLKRGADEGLQELERAMAGVL